MFAASVKVPEFCPAPIVVGGLCVVQLGGDRGGAVAAFDLATGEERWRWAGDGTKYASPAVLTADGTTIPLPKLSFDVLPSDDVADRE